MLKTTKPTSEMVDETAVAEQVDTAQAEKSVAEFEEAIADTDADPVLEDREEDEEQPVSKAVANPSANLPAVDASAVNITAFLADLEKQGFVGLKVEFGTFPMISIDGGEFKAGETLCGKTPFNFVPLASRPKYCYRNTNAPEKEKDAVWEDQPDAHLQPNSTSAKAIAEWQTKGWGFDVKEYQNVLGYVVTMPACPNLESQLAILSIAPTSVKAYSGAAIFCKTKGYEPFECLFEAKMGEKIKGKSGDWYPWVFDVKGSLKKLGVEVKFGVKDENF